MAAATLMVKDQTAKNQAARSSPLSNLSKSITSAFMESGKTRKVPPQKPVQTAIGSIQ